MRRVVMETKPSATVESVCEYLEMVSPLTAFRNSGFGEHSWIFRGQQETRASWKLSPRVGRDEWFGAIFSGARELPAGQAEQMRHYFGLLPDKVMFEQWCRRSKAYCDNLPTCEVDRLALAQHYGLATRLLDWSRNPLVALFFAVEDDKPSDKAQDCAVYGLLEPPTFEPDISVWQTIPAVWLYEPPPIDRRMLAQAALFTLHGSPEREIKPKAIVSKLPENGEGSSRVLENLRPDIERIGFDLIEFIVPGRKKHDIRVSLASLGMTRETLFPDLDGLSAQLNYAHRATAKDLVAHFHKGNLLEI